MLSMPYLKAASNTSVECTVLSGSTLIGCVHMAGELAIPQITLHLHLYSVPKICVCFLNDYDDESTLT